MRLPESWEKSLGSLGSDRALATIRTGAELERALAERRRRPPLATGLGPLDRLQGGGLPRGSLIELCGRRSSGRLALALAALAAATTTGEPSALIDPGDQLDPEGARSAGVALERLLWVRPKTPKAALAAAEALVDAGFALVVLELGEVGIGKRLPGPAARRPVRETQPQPQSWVRLARAARAQSAVVLLVSGEPVAGTAADVVIAAEKARTLWDRGAWPPLLSGVASRLSITRRRRLGGPPGTETLSLSGPAE